MLLFALLGVAAMTAGVPAVALAVPPGSVSGTVTDATTFAGISGITVQVETPDGTPVTSATTTSGGAYTVSGLAPATNGYAVQFDPTLSDGYQTQWYSDASRWRTRP